MKNMVTVLTMLLYLSNLVLAQDNNGSSHKPQFINFKPGSFSNKFSLNNAPVLRIYPGDTISTETIDAMGRDKNGLKRQSGGNPLTGPFYIEGAQAGDVLAITLTKISLNRPYAYTSESFVSRSMPDSIAKQFKKPHLLKWKIDMENRMAWPDSSYNTYSHLENFKVPVLPFLGCIGVAPSNKHNEILSFFQGDFGGNLDFNGVRQSAILYLPVLHDGGYLYIGDGHAVQGDGEIAGNALETSLDVEFTIKLISGNSTQITYPRVEDSISIMATGVAKTLDDAIKIATENLSAWLQADYQLTLQEVTQVMSTTIEYIIAEIADPEVVVVAKIKKEMLGSLKKYK